MLSFFPRDSLDEIWDLVGSVSEGFPTYSSKDTSGTGRNRTQGLHFMIPDKNPRKKAFSKKHNALTEGTP